MYVLNVMQMSSIPIKVLRSYSSKQIFTLFTSDESYTKTVKDLQKLTINANINILIIPDIDRGVTCWISFLKLIETKFPNCESIYLSRNYSYHRNDNRCNVSHPSFNNIFDEINYALSKSNIKNIFLLDCQSFTDDFYNLSISGLNIVSDTILNDKRLYVEKDIDCIDNTINFKFNDNNYQSTLHYVIHNIDSL